MPGNTLRVALAVWIVGAVAGCRGADPVPPTKATDDSVTSAPPLAKPVVAKISAVDLCKQYVSNEAAADEAFKGKFIEVTGEVVVPMGVGFGPDHFFVISGSGPDKPGAAPFIRCFFAAEYSKLEKPLLQGKTVILRGFCEGRSVDSQTTLIDLKRCVITRTEP